MKNRGIEVRTVDISSKSISKSLYPVESVAVAIFMMVAGVFVVALGAGWLWQNAEEIPLVSRILMYVVGLLMIAGSAYLIGNELMLGVTPLKTTSEGLYLPTSQSRFRKKIKQRFLLGSEIARLSIHDRGYGLEVVVVMKSGKRIKFLCSVDWREDLERFWPQGQT